MHTWAAISAGTTIPPHRLSLSRAANERYWSAAGGDHPTLAGGSAYPMIAANCTVLAWLETCDTPMIQTRQQLRSHRAVSTPVDLVTAGRVVGRHERRGRDYVTVEVEVGSAAGPLWASTVDFTPVETFTRPGRVDVRPARADRVARARLDGPRRRAVVTDDSIRRYSRRGNYHSEPSTAAEFGLPGLVAQGTQVCGPAYALLLEAWGEAFVAHGQLDARFVGIVVGGDEIETTVAVAADRADFEVWNRTRDRLAATGSARTGRTASIGTSISA